VIVGRVALMGAAGLPIAAKVGKVAAKALLG
jgi:hypothetical protein